MENLNPALQVEGENRTIFVNKIDELITQGKQKQAIERIITTMNKKLLAGKPVEKSTETIAPKKTRADSGIFVKGAIANSDDTKYNIEVPGQGIVLFDLFDVNPRAKYVNEQIKKYEQGLESDITSSKQKNSLVKELKGHKVVFRDQLTQINQGKDTKAPTEYDTFKNFPQDLSLDELIPFLRERGFGLPEDQEIYKGEKIVAVGQGGFTIQSTEGFLRYIEYDQTKFKKELAKQAKEAEKEQKQKEKLGFELSTAPETETETTGTFTTKIEKLLANIDKTTQDRYIAGKLTDVELTGLSPILQKAYPRQKKIAQREQKKTEKAEKKKEKKAFKVIDETVYYSKITGRKITQEELDKNDFLLDEIIDDSGNFITEAQAKQIEIKRKPKKASELTQREREDLTFQDEFGNVVEPFDVVVDTAKSKAESKASKKASQDKFIKEYKEGNTAVIKRILLPGRKELARDGLYDLTEEELQGMSKTERKKFTTVEREPEVEQSRSKVDKKLDEQQVVSDSTFIDVFSNQTSESGGEDNPYPTGGTAGTDEEEEAGEEDYLLEE